jgi:hypothetical protein
MRSSRTPVVASSVAPVLALAWCAALGGCRSTPGDVTALRIVSRWTAVRVDQLEFGVTDGLGNPLAVAQRRPARPAGPLASGADVVVNFGDQLGGSDVTCEVRGLLAGTIVAAGQTGAHLVTRTLVTAQVGLTALAASRPDGAACRDGGECASGHCADGVCCLTSCAGACLSCNVPGKQGTCSPVPEGVEHPTCADQGTASCGFDGTCDGRGSCRKYPAGSRCSPGRCSGSSITAEGACDGDGRCELGPVVTCAPFSCDPSGDIPICFSRCTTSDQCVPGRQCLTGSCGTKLDGAACVDSTECTTGFCVDGICCDSPCDGPCSSCAGAGSTGVCRPVPEGVRDPRGLCRDDGPATCGHTGACNGTGGCARYPTGTICVAATCRGAVLQSAGRCDGAGACLMGSDLTCAPFACRNGTCNSVCHSDEDCAAGQACDATGSCGKKGQGQPCAAATECLTGHCIDGVCCDSACQGPCRSCVLGQTPGRCTVSAPGTLDPRGACLDRGKSLCDTDGTCEGGGGCSRYPAGTVCSASVCNAATGVRTLARTCNGNGLCSPGQTIPCDRYRCNGAVCFSACSSDAECVPPNTCNAGACTERGLGSPCSPAMACPPPLSCNGTTCQLARDGTACTADAECSSGHCSDGVCCEDGPCGACQSCNVPGFAGFCHALPAGDGSCR